MKVIDLLKALEAFDTEMPVMLAGYEGGYSDVQGVVEQRTFVKDVNCAWYYGPHELDTEFLDQEEHGFKPRFQAVTLY